MSILLQLDTKELINYKVYHGLTDSPPGSSQTLPEAEQSALGVNPPDDHGKVAVGPIKLEPGLDQPDGVCGTGTDKACRVIKVLLKNNGAMNF